MDRSPPEPYIEEEDMNSKGYYQDEGEEDGTLLLLHIFGLLYEFGGGLGLF